MKVSKIQEKLSFLQKALEKIKQTSKKIIETIEKEISENYGKFLSIKKENDFELLLNYFGNELHICAQIAYCSKCSYQGEIVCFYQDKDKKIYLTEGKYSFNSIGNFTEVFDVYVCIESLLTKLHKELSEKQILVNLI